MILRVLLAIIFVGTLALFALDVARVMAGGGIGYQVLNDRDFEFFSKMNPVIWPINLVNKGAILSLYFALSWRLMRPSERLTLLVGQTVVVISLLSMAVMSFGNALTRANLFMIYQGAGLVASVIAPAAFLLASAALAWLTTQTTAFRVWGATSACVVALVGLYEGILGVIGLIRPDVVADFAGSAGYLDFAVRVVGRFGLLLGLTLVVAAALARARSNSASDTGPEEESRAGAEVT